MKRLMLRLSALSLIAVLGLIAIAQAQRQMPPDTLPAEAANDAAPLAPLAQRLQNVPPPIPAGYNAAGDDDSFSPTARAAPGQTPVQGPSQEPARFQPEPPVQIPPAAMNSSPPMNPQAVDDTKSPTDPFIRPSTDPSTPLPGGNSAPNDPFALAPASNMGGADAAATDAPTGGPAAPQPLDGSGARPLGTSPTPFPVSAPALAAAQAPADGGGEPMLIPPQAAPQRFPSAAPQPIAADSAAASDSSGGGSSGSDVDSSGRRSVLHHSFAEPPQQPAPPRRLAVEQEASDNTAAADSSTADSRAAFGDGAAPDAPRSDADSSGRPGGRPLEGAQCPQLTIQKLAPPEVSVGKPTHFEIKVRNSGTVTAQDVEIRDEIPHGTRLLSTNPQATAGPHGELTWSLGALQPGGQAIVRLELMPVAEGEIGSMASVTFRADASVRTLATRPQLVMEVAAPKQVLIGDEAPLTIRISNPGTGAATGIVLWEKVPAGLRHAAGADLEFKVGTLKPGQSRTIELALTAAQAGHVVNVLQAQGDANLRAHARAEIDVVAPGLSVAVTGPTRRYLERQATYTVSVSNPGTAPAKNVELVTQLPKGLKFVKANNLGHFDPQTNTVTWSLAELPPAETGSVTLVAVPTETGQHTVTIEGKAQQGLVDRKEQTTMVEGLAAVEFDVRGADEAIEVGGETTYQIHVVNRGSKAAANLQVAALFPPEMTPLRTDGGRAELSEHGVQFEPIAQLAPNAEVTFRIRAKAIQPGDLRIKAQLLVDDMRQPVTKEESTRVYVDR